MTMQTVKATYAREESFFWHENVSDIESWLVAQGLGNNRDADSLTRSNHAVAVERLNAAGEDDWRLMQMGHWACGWYDVVIVRPGSACAVVAADLIDALDDYPALDEHAWSEMQSDEATKAFASWGWRDFAAALGHEATLDYDACDVLLYVAESRCPDGSWLAEDDGPTFTQLAGHVEREELALALVCSRLRARGADVHESF